jgi:GYF domain 2
MSNRAWFYASEGQQYGPYPEVQLREFIARGTVTAGTLVWSEGMVNWQKAGEIPGLLSGASGPPTLPHAGGSLMTGAIVADGSLSADFGTWALLGRGLLVVIGDLTVIAAPWTKTGFYRWFVAHLRIPQRPGAVFTGKPGDIWYAFVVLALGIYAGLIHVSYLKFALIPVQAFCWWIIIRWFIANISPDGQQHPLTFTGSVWGYVGWYLLALVSFLTIIGWAWVFTAWGRWMCRNVDGTRREITFNASGWQMLWRTLLFSVAMVLIIPIPWALAWYARWSVSQFTLAERAA